MNGPNSLANIKVLSSSFSERHVVAIWHVDIELLKALFEHPAMAPNREQTFMTPAKKKTRVYFMWDFVGRTLGMLYQIPPKLPASVTDKEDNVWMSVVGRSNSFVLHYVSRRGLR